MYVNTDLLGNVWPVSSNGVM